MESGSNSSGQLFWATSPKGEQLGLIVRSGYPVSGVEFLTPDNFGQQLALMQRPKGERIQPHIHLPVNRELNGTQEVIIMKSGRMRVDYYESTREYVGSTVLEAGDIALMNSGGHGFELLEDSVFIEVKQGPFVEGKDKVRFTSDYQGARRELAP
jgi:hypothetical protein